MNWSEVAAVVTILAVLGGLALWFVKDQVEKGLSKQTDDIKTWINGSFMRSATVSAKLEAIDGRLNRLEQSHG